MIASICHSVLTTNLLHFSLAQHLDMMMMIIFVTRVPMFVSLIKLSMPMTMSPLNSVTVVFVTAEAASQ